MWYLMWCNDDNSYSIIHHQHVLNIGDVEIGSNVQFFYGNKPYFGKITEMNEDREVVDSKLKALGVSAKRVSKKVDSVQPPTGTLLEKRTRSSNPPTKQGPSKLAEKPVDSKKKPDYKNKKLLEMNRQISLMKENKQMLPQLVSETDSTLSVQEWMAKNDNGKKKKNRRNSDSDEEWLPRMDDDDDKPLNDLFQHSKKRKDERVSLIKGIKMLDPIAIPSLTSQKTVISSSPSKDELKRQLEEYKMKLQFIYDNESNKEMSSPNKSEDDTSQTNINSHHKEPSVEVHGNVSEELPNMDPNIDHDTSATSHNSREESDDIEFELSKHQLFGQCEDTVKIGENIYCKKDVLKSALRSSTEVSHLARRLIEGVFKLDAILSCTLTGTPYKAGGKDNIIKVDGLNKKAVETIIAYSKHYGGLRKWPSKKVQAIKTSMSQRLGEIKRKEKKEASH